MRVLGKCFITAGILIYIFAVFYKYTSYKHNTVLLNDNVIVAQAEYIYTQDITISNIYNAINAIRLKNGLEPVRLNNALTKSSHDKAIRMVDTDCWSHLCGYAIFQDIDYSVYKFNRVGEILANGYKSTDNVINAWLESPTHKTELLCSAYNNIGISIQNGLYQHKTNNTLIVVHFGALHE